MKYLAVFADRFGIRPWEWDRLTADEAVALIRAAEQIIEEANGNGQ